MRPPLFNIRKSVTQSHQESLDAKEGDIDIVKRFNIFGLTGINCTVLTHRRLYGVTDKDLHQVPQRAPPDVLQAHHAHQRGL